MHGGDRHRLDLLKATTAAHVELLQRIGHVADKHCIILFAVEETRNGVKLAWTADRCVY